MPNRPLFDRLASRLTTAVPEHRYHREPRPPDDVPLAVQWLGTAGFRVVANGCHFWLDPHLSRHAWHEVLLDPLTPDLDRVRADVDLAHAVAVGHSHYDHAIDAPAIALLHDAPVYGASDTLHACRSLGVPERLLHELRGEGETHDVGPFRLQAFRSEHSPFALGRVPFPGRIERPFAMPARASAWRVGPVFGLHLSAAAGSVYHVGSAALVEAELRGVQADVVLCCTIGRHATPDFTRRVLDALRPKVVIPCHWDQFWRPFGDPALQIPGNDLEGFLDEVAAHPLAPEVRLLPFRGWTRLA